MTQGDRGRQACARDSLTSPVRRRYNHLVEKRGFSFSSFASFGVRPGDSDEIRTAKTIWWVCMWFAIPASWIMFALGRVFGWENFGEYWLAMAVFFSVLFVVYFFLRRGIEWIGLASQLFLVVSSLFYSAREGGLLRSGGIVFIGMIGPLYALAFPKVRRAAYLMLAYLAGVAALAMLQPPWQHASGLPPAANLWLFISSFAAVAVFAFVALMYFVGQRDSALRRLAEEQERSESLLLNILPREVAAVLKRGNRVIADQYEAASILFADVVDFTPLSAGMKPVEIVGMLDEVFSLFDELADRHGLEKIKTIGDCYMVAAGIPRSRPDHAQALTDMALEIRELVAGRTFAGRRLAFRIGIQSGPVVAGVIGRRKFIYDLWGDAVNTASRMESHGMPGVIQITRGTYELIRGEFDCRPVPPVRVKGKGEMEVWHVQGRRGAPEEGAGGAG